MTTAPKERSHERHDRALAVIRPVLAVLGDDAAPPEGAPFDDAAVEQLVDETLRRVRERLEDGVPQDESGRLALAALQLADIRHELVNETMERRWSGLGNVQVALGRLRAVRSTEEMMRRAPHILCEQCGFSTAIMTRVAEGRLLPVSAHREGAPAWGETLMETLTDQHPIFLDETPLETEMLRRRTAVIVHDAYNDPRTQSHQEVWRASETPTYVAAPIMPEGRVIGFLHASVTGKVDLVDRDVLWAFAEGYGYALERTMLVERLYQHGEHMRELLRATDQVLEQLREADLQIAGGPSEASPERVRSAAFAGPQSAIHDLLTRREIEIIELMAHGDTNRQIADRLIVSEGTAKAHVSQILRKLKAANRAEAVSHYTRLLHNRS